jgi:hypothetical protein
VRKTIMRYDVTYLAAGERETTQLEALDAATAVAVVAAEQGYQPPTFELLSVVPAPEPETPAES